MSGPSKVRAMEGIKRRRDELARQKLMGVVTDLDYLMNAHEALEGMVHQFAHWHGGVGGYTTGGLSALEDAFEALGWEDPHPYPKGRCDEPDCMEQATCGWPTSGGYRRTCGKHWIRES